MKRARSDEPPLSSSLCDEPSECPYLETIDRGSISFDSPPICTTTLATTHIYTCLVCGQFYRGRGKNTPAYNHALEEGHYVFMGIGGEDIENSKSSSSSLSSSSSTTIPLDPTVGKFYCLPDNYEVKSSTLNDISLACTGPKYSAANLPLLDTNKSLSRDNFGSKYLPGFQGLNNLRKTDYISVVVVALCHVKPFRNYFLVEFDQEVNERASLFRPYSR